MPCLPHRFATKRPGTPSLLRESIRTAVGRTCGVLQVQFGRKLRVRAVNLSSNAFHTGFAIHQVHRASEIFLDGFISEARSMQEFMNSSERDCLKRWSAHCCHHSRLFFVRCHCEKGRHSDGTVTGHLCNSDLSVTWRLSRPSLRVRNVAAE